MISVNIFNDDGAHDIFATVTDLLTLPPSTPMVNQRIQRGQRAAVNVEDSGGQCQVNVLAINADDTSKQKAFDNQSCSAGQDIKVDVFGV